MVNVFTMGIELQVIVVIAQCLHTAYPPLLLFLLSSIPSERSLGGAKKKGSPDPW